MKRVFGEYWLAKASGMGTLRGCQEMATISPTCIGRDGPSYSMFYRSQIRVDREPGRSLPYPRSHSQLQKERAKSQTSWFSFWKLPPCSGYPGLPYPLDRVSQCKPGQSQTYHPPASVSQVLENTCLNYRTLPTSLLLCKARDSKKGKEPESSPVRGRVVRNLRRPSGEA